MRLDLTRVPVGAVGATLSRWSLTLAEGVLKSNTKCVFYANFFPPGGSYLKKNRGTGTGPP